MYSSGFSQVHKYSPEAQKKMPYRSKGKSCGYYMRIVFFFSSLIQTLIIVSLVLFLVYGNKEDTASTSHIQDLERSFSKLSIENVALRQQRKNLTNLLNVTLINKAINDWDMKRFHSLINISALVIQDLQKKNQQCNNELMLCKFSPSVACQPTLRTGCNCGVLVEQLKARLQLVESNFTHTVQKMRIEMDQTVKERDELTLDTIQLRKDKSILGKELELYQHKIKDDFSHHLSSVSNVSKAFLQKIDSLFPAHIPFQLTCAKQREHLEQIRTNCTSLSREVEDKLQGYLNVVGSKVSDIQAENNRLIAENWRLSDDYRWCSQNRSGLIREHRMNLDKLQGKHDKDKVKLLMDKLRLNGEIDVLTNNVKFKTKEVDHLKEQVKNLNMSCMSKGGFGVSTSRGYTPPQTGWNTLGGGGSSFGSSSSASGASRTGSVSLGSSVGSFGSFNKPLSTGTSSSLASPSNPGLSSTGTGFNKPVSTGTGSSGSTFSSAGSNPGLSSTGSLFNKPVSTRTGSSSSAFSSAGSNPGLSSTGSGFNKPISTGTGSSSSSVLSPGSSPGLGSSGSGGIKPPSTGTGYSSSSSSTGSSPNLGSAGSEVNKPASTGGIFSGFGSTGLSSSGTGLNKPVVTARGTSTSSSSSSSSSSSGSSSGSVGPNPNLSSNSNKPATSVKSSPGLGPSVGSGSTSRTSSISGLSWFGFGNSNSGQSKAGSATGKESGTSQSGTGSSFGAGRTNGLGGGTINVAQHLQELQRIINPPGPEEKQDLSRMLG